MTKEQAKKELDALNKSKIFGLTMDELADIRLYKEYLQEIINK